MEQERLLVVSTGFLQHIIAADEIPAPRKQWKLLIQLPSASSVKFQVLKASQHGDPRLTPCNVRECCKARVNRWIDQRSWLFSFTEAPMLCCWTVQLPH